MRKLRVLIADDDREIRDWLRLALRPLRASEIVEARDGAELEELLLGQDSFDVTVTDIRMPRRSGLEAAAAARRAGHRVPFVFFTGFGDEQTKAEVRALGRAVLVSKPVDGLDLLEHIRRLLGDDHDGGNERC
jgi:CheY-like chemotaxis protein